MRAPKCKICQTEHWGVCYTPATVVKTKVAAIESKSVKPRNKMAANAQAKHIDARPTKARPKTKPKTGKPK